MTDRDSRGHRRRLRPGDIVVALPEFVVTREAIGGKRCVVLCMRQGRWRITRAARGTWGVWHLLRHELRLAKRAKAAS